MNNAPVIRLATAADLAQVTALFRSTVETINAKDYSAEQIAVWAESAANTERWLQKIAEQYFLLACFNDIVSGFASVTGNGYLDFMYIHKDYQRMGIARKLLSALEKYAREKNIHALYSDVSITAKGFFEKYGFRVKARQENILKGIMLVNYRMEKFLHT